MEKVIYKKGSNPLQGNVQIPPSKSAAHRAILCAALSKGNCLIQNVEISQDIQVTISAIEALGAITTYHEDSKELSISADSLQADFAAIDCGESGSSLRFLIPIAAALGIESTFTGKGRLPERPLETYYNLLPFHGITMKSNGKLPLIISGQLTAGDFYLPGNISSQFITGLLLALPLLPKDSRILLTSPLESEGYVNLTISIMKDFGVQVNAISNGWQIKGNQKYKAKNYTIEGDWSHVAFFLSLASFNSKPITISGLRFDSVQGDKACLDLYRKFGLTIEESDHSLVAYNPKAELSFHGLHSQEIDASQVPDLVPALAACAAGCKGITKIYNAERLRIKECDRLFAMRSAIQTLGGEAEETEDGLMIIGKEKLMGGEARGMNDHRILMALSAVAAISENPVTVTDAWSIRKSYPNFYQDFIQLGGIADVINVG